MSSDPSRIPDPRETREFSLRADMPRLANEVVELSGNIEPPYAEESVYTFNAAERILRLPRHLQNFLELSEKSPKLVGVEVKFSSAKKRDHAEIMVSFELTNGQIIRASRASSSSIDQVFSVSLKQDGHDYEEAVDMSYAPFPAHEITRLLTGLVFEREELARFPEGSLGRIDIQEFGTSTLLKAALGSKADSYRVRKAVSYDDPLGHRLIVTTGSDETNQSQYAEITIVTVSFDDGEDGVVAVEKTESIEFDSGADTGSELSLSKSSVVQNIESEHKEPTKRTLIPATLGDLLRINRFLRRMKRELVELQPETIAYRDTDDDS